MTTTSFGFLGFPETEPPESAEDVARAEAAARLLLNAVKRETIPWPIRLPWLVAAVTAEDVDDGDGGGVAETGGAEGSDDVVEETGSVMER